MESMYTERTHCLACGSVRLPQVLDLGNQYVVDFVKERSDSALRSPLVLVLCPSCHLLQLRHVVNPDRLYKKFWYRSSISEVMRLALRDVVTSAVRVTDVRAGDTVLDIGCNDGTMLEMYPRWIKTVGVDPCASLVKDAATHKRLDVGVTGYFRNANPLTRMAPYKVVTAIAMFYDLENPGNFLNDVKALLHEDGTFIIQMNYLLGMLRNMAFDNICHEHVAYYSLSSLKALVEQHGLQIVGAETNDVNGGSLRVYITHEGKELSSTVLSESRRLSLYTCMRQLELEESQAGLDKAETYEAFNQQALTVRNVINGYILRCLSIGKKVYAYGASTRGSTLFQYLDLPENAIKGAAERDPAKWGLKTVGTWIPIMSEEDCRNDADVFIVQPWHFWDGIRLRERPWLAKGGTFLVPLPTPRVVTVDYEEELLDNVVRQ